MTTPDVAEERRRLSLGEICQSGNGSIQTGPFGSQLHAEDYRDDGIPIITVEHIQDGRILHENLPLVGDADAKRLSRYTLASGDLVFSRVGAIDRCGFVSDRESGWLFSGRCLRVRTAKATNSWFLAYCLNSWQKRRWILNHSVGSTMKCLNTGILASVPIELPPAAKQSRIVAILSTLDGTIEYTDAQITKYQLIRAGLIQALFTRGVTPDGQFRPAFSQAPGLYKRSTLGWIPNDWRTGVLQDIVNPNRPIVYGILMPGPGVEQGVPVIKVKDIVGGEILTDDLMLTSFEIDSAYARSKLRCGDILLTIRGTVGRVAAVPEALNDANITQDTARIGIVKGVPAYYQSYLTSDNARAHFAINTIGVAVQGINLRDVRATPIPIPEIDEQRAVSERISSLTKTLTAMTEELVKLGQLKQGLMDDILTGRVHVPFPESMARS